ncbi:hypothetical protein A2U01_0092135 [Trifolium medium]|uniref:Uncharacterized protein n=1 Tax=Trifolium medium TaxID=97028 RepID=A0A392UBU3_9FABA|nr:hypothetical protein [Trifolium medium]
MGCRALRVEREEDRKCFSRWRVDRSTGALRRLVQKIASWALLVARCAGRYGALRR